MSPKAISLEVVHLQNSVIIGGTAAGVGYNLSSADPGAGLRAQTAVIARPLLTLRAILVPSGDAVPVEPPAKSPEALESKP